MSIKEAKKNCSTIFLLPGIGLHRKDILRYGFLSAYIDDSNHEIHYNNAVYLLFRPDIGDVRTYFQEFLNKEYDSNSSLVEDYDYEGGYTVVVYKFPGEFEEEYNLFLVGKYSQFSKKYTDLFPREIAVEDKEGNRKMEFSLQYHIFTRTDSIKRYWEEKIGVDLPETMEMWSSPDINKETLDINNI